MNDIPNTQRCLSMDIQKAPINFVAIRILNYLDTNALIALMFFLLNNAPSNSRFIIANGIAVDKKSKPACFNRGYIASFFGARTDMTFLLMTKTAGKLKNLPASKEHQEDEVLVVQKL